jgi:predicted cytidylate kinase
MGVIAGMKYQKITISGQICTGKSTLYCSLSSYLKWPLFSTGAYFRQIAKKNKLSLEKAEEQNDQLTKQVDNKVKELLQKKEHILVEGWMAGIMAGGLNDVLKVLLIASNSERVKRFSNREKVSLQIAKRLLKQREDSWLKQIEKIYKRRDIFKKQHYDLVINTTNTSPTKVFQLVVQKLK